jgi:hypothetical protein
MISSSTPRGNVAGRAAADRAKSGYAYDDLIRSLDKVLKDANFDELPTLASFMLSLWELAKIFSSGL